MRLYLFWVKLKIDLEIMKSLFIAIFIFTSLISPQLALASHIPLKPCLQISHCVLEEWDVDKIQQPLSEIQIILENTPRTKIVELDGDYIHAEVQSRIMKFVDDLEVTFDKNTNQLMVRSESRVGDGDFGVNKKRIQILKDQLFNS